MNAILRRDFLKLLLASGTLGAGTLNGIPSFSAQQSFRPDLIDVHAHLFNATDIPVRSFLKTVVFEHYSEQDTERLLDFGVPDTVNWLISLFVWVVAGRAPTARDEITHLAALAPRTDPAIAIEDSARITKERLSTFMQQLEGRGSQTELQLPLPSGKSKLGRERFRLALKRAAADGARDPGALSVDQFDADAAFLSPTDVGTYLRWFNLFTLYRHTLAAQLVQSYRENEVRPLLIAPALVNYSRWLDEKVTSSFEDQVEVMGLVSRQAKDTLIHGYVCYDPLAQVYFRRGFKDYRDQLALIKSAVEDHGFIGVKLYPPMGFKPLRNERGQLYPKPILDELGSRLSEDLNEAMDQLFNLCTQLDIPVLAHAAASNSAGPKYSDRGDPAFWLPVFAKYPKLRLCLAHFGRFSYRSAAAPPGSSLPESSWEWTLGRHIRRNPDNRLYADLSYLTEVQTQDKLDRQTVGRQLRQYVSEFDPKLDRLVFGSDWIMLGKEPRSAEYAVDVIAFLKSEVGIKSQTTMDRVMRFNAVRFLGLAPGNQTRERLVSFYKRYELDDRRLEVFDQIH